MTQTAMDKETRPLPAGWKWVKLGELTANTRPIQYGVLKPGPFVEGGIPMVRVTDISRNQFNPNNLYQISRELDEEFSRSRLNGGEILISVQGTIGKVAICPPEYKGSNVSRTIAIISPDSSKARTDFVYHCLRFLDELDAYPTVGSTRASLNIGALRELSISLPPLEEQKRIAAILNEQMAAVEKAKKAAEERLEAAKALPAAYLRDVFEGVIPISVESTPTDAPEGWKWELLTNVARLESGHTPSRKHPEYWENGDIPWLALPDIRAVDGKHCEITSENTNELGIKNSSARILPKGTVALSRTASVGFATIFDCPMATSQDFVNWVCSNKVLPEFLLLALISSRDYIRKLSSGATHKTVYVPTVKSFRICMPSTSVQEQLSEVYLGNRGSLNPISTNIQHELETIEAMPAALLRKAFAGEL